MKSVSGVLLATVCAAGIAGAAQGQSLPDNPPAKKIFIYNNSDVPMYPVVEMGKKDVDEWLQAQSKVPAKDIKTVVWKSAQVVRIYPAGTTGIGPHKFLGVNVPFYSRLVANPDGTKTNQYVDWWNGGRVWMYDDADEINAHYKADSANEIVPLADIPTTCHAGECTTPTKVFSSNVGLPSEDHAQLMEYTFGDAITANGAPYPMHLSNVGYNISSVDQVYLPVAMEPFGNKFVPYIGTVIGLTPFQNVMKNFLQDFPGWPIYLTSTPDKPRIPGAYNVFVDAAIPPDKKHLLTAPGESVTSMVNLYKTCVVNSQDWPICKQWQEVFALFQANWNKYQGMACHNPNLEFDQATILKYVYGWVPFNDGCGPAANALKNSYGNYDTDPNARKKFDHALAVYTDGLQPTAQFNPYFQLIHNTLYLNMAAYAFSVDDAVGFQHWKGNGLVITVAGAHGLPNPNKLNKDDLINIAVGAPLSGDPGWSRYGLCSRTPDYDKWPNARDGNNVSFYPPSYPCWFTTTDTNGNTYQGVVASGPRSGKGLTAECPADVSNPNWCRQFQVVNPHQINAPQPLPPK